MKRPSLPRVAADRMATWRTSLARRLHLERPIGVRLVLATLLALVVALSLAIVVVAAVLPAVYQEYGYHPEENAQAWAARTPTYGTSALCRSCHAPEVAEWSSSGHEGVSCESCHGALGMHATTQPPAPVEAGTPTGSLCVTCHQATVGRPVSFPQVVQASHYPAATCLQCHTGHSTEATRPAEVPHRLTNMPNCVVCHAPDGLKKVPSGHALVADAVCLSCHAPATRTLEGTRP